MKKSVLNLLRGGVFVLAAVAAFAFTQPIKVTTAFGAERDANGVVIQWHTVDLSNPENYECDELQPVGCIYEQQSETSTMLVEGKFIP